MRTTKLLLADRHPVVNPSVLIPDPDKLANWANESPRPFVSKKLSGRFFRVYPQTARDVQFLLLLEHRMDKWASSESDGGTIVRAELLTEL